MPSLDNNMPENDKLILIRQIYILKDEIVRLRTMDGRRPTEVIDELETAAQPPTTRIESTMSTPAIFGAAKRVQGQFGYMLGSLIVKHFGSFSKVVSLPTQILSLIRRFRADKHSASSKKLPALERYADFSEAERVRQHLSFRVGVITLNSTKSLVKLLYLPWALISVVSDFRRGVTWTATSVNRPRYLWRWAYLLPGTRRLDDLLYLQGVELREMQIDLSNANARIKRSEHALRQNEQTKRSAELKLREVQGQLIAESTRIKTLEEGLTEEKNRGRILKRNLSKCRDRLRAAYGSLSTARRCMESQRTDIERISEMFNGEASARHRLEEDRDQLLNGHRYLSEVLVQRELSLTELKQEVNEMSKTAEALRRRLADSEAENRSIKNQGKETLAALVREWDERLNAYAFEKESLQKSLDTREDELTCLQLELHSVAEKCQSLEAEQVAARAGWETLAHKNREKIKKLEKELGTVSKIVTRLRTDKAQLTAELAESKGKVHSLNVALNRQSDKYGEMLTNLDRAESQLRVIQSFAAGRGPASES